MKRLLLLLICVPQLLFSQDGKTELTSLSPGTNEIQFEYDGLTRRLIITTPNTYDDQSIYPALFFSMEQEVKLTVKVKDGALKPMSVALL